MRCLLVLLLLLLLSSVTKTTTALAFSSSICSRSRELRDVLSTRTVTATIRLKRNGNWRRLNIARTGISEGDENYSASEIQEMQDLILSLSLESDDAVRRERVASLFETALARPSSDQGIPYRFCDLFSQTLTRVGNQVQDDLRKQASADASAAAPSDNHQGAAVKAETEDRSEAVDTAAVDKSSNNTDKDFFEVIGKTKQELQLWALVDIMVQSKTIVKRATEQG